MSTFTPSNWNGPICGKRRKSNLRTPIVPGSLAAGKIEVDTQDGKFTMEEAAPKIVIGLDFGTTYSGFAYALASDIESVQEFCDWPGQAASGGKPYCKTETSLRYILDEITENEFHLQDWGCYATINHRQASEQYLVVHEKMDSSGPKVREVAPPTGRLCGGSYINDGFHTYLSERVSCYETFRRDFPATVMRMQRQIEEQKYSYDGEDESFAINLDVPAKLATAWENSDKANGTWHEDGKYDELIISEKDVRKVFDAVVNPILEVIRAQIAAVPDVEAIMVVGGFSSSPYLMKRIRDEFSPVVKHILNPPDPGSAVSRGAVAFGGLSGDLLLSRKCRKTYGISIARPFQIGDPADFLSREDGQFMCLNVFWIFIRKGEDVPVDRQTKYTFEIPRGLTTPEFEIYATDAVEPKFVTDAEVQRVGVWSYRLPRGAQRMRDAPKVEVAMFFGRTTIEVMLVPVNFRGKAQQMTCEVKFEADLY
ncbi:hypothetical protein R1sor_027398 [Riccia sorocarpa]|uniref:Uncharacterized protein n=1 Tax=Riccia sorocarpa TaxID=122646 RepID=A0ABD3GH87_9MARC